MIVGRRNLIMPVIGGYDNWKKIPTDNTKEDV